jgi:hypothetical protein
MKAPKLIRVLSTFTKQEFKDFGKFIASPYFNTNRNLSHLYNTFKDLYPSFNISPVTVEQIYKAFLKKRKSASYALLKIQMSAMYKLAGLFLTIQKSQKEIGLNTFFLATNCRERGLYEIAESIMSRSFKEISKSDIGGSFYRNYYFGQVELINLYFLRDMPAKGTHTVNHLSEIILHEFLCNASRYINNLIEFQSIFNISTKDNLLYTFFISLNYESLLSHLENKSDKYSVASLIYTLYILTFLKPEEDKYYFSLKSNLFENISLFSPFDQSGLLQAVNRNADWRMTGRNYKKFAMEIFDIINFRLKNGLHKQNTDGPYTTNEFLIAFYIGFILKKKKWLNSFFKNYINEVHPKQREATSLIANSLFFFLNKDYRNCLKNTSVVKSKDFGTECLIKRLQLMAYFEVSLTSEAFYAINAFRAYLKNNKKGSEDTKVINFAFLEFYTLLLKYKHKEIDLDLKQLALKIHSAHVANQEWLLEKAFEI